MERKGLRKLVVLTMVIISMLVVVEGHEDLSELDKCLGRCYPKCQVTRPLWCATLCIGKCKHSKSIPDNLCNCTYSCSKFKCGDVGSDPEKVGHCVKSCSRLCNMKP